MFDIWSLENEKYNQLNENATLVNLSKLSKTNWEEILHPLAKFWCKWKPQYVKQKWHLCTLKQKLMLSLEAKFCYVVIIIMSMSLTLLLLNPSLYACSFWKWNCVDFIISWKSLDLRKCHHVFMQWCQSDNLEKS